MKSCVFRRPSMLRTTLLHSLSANSITSSSISKKKNTICSKRKIKVLVMRLLELSSIRNEFFAYVPVQKWLATKEINFKILTASGIFDQEVKCLLPTSRDMIPDFATVLTFTRKTVFAVHITSMCDVETDCFKHRLFSF